MIVVINSKGQVVSQQADNFFQGSNNADTINLIAPFADNVIFKANFKTPTGQCYPEDKQGYILRPSIQVVKDLNCWYLPISFPITQYSGVVEMQLRGYVGSQVVCTSNVKITVQKGIPYASEYVEPDTYDAVLQLISDLRGIVNNKTDMVHNKYEVASVTPITTGTYYVFDTTDNTYEQKTLPADYVEGTTYYAITQTGKVINNDDGVYVEISNDKNSLVMEFTPYQVNINGNRVVTWDNLQAQNVEFDNNYSHLENTHTVQEAIDKIDNKVENIETSQMIALGKITLDKNSWVDHTYGDGEGGVVLRYGYTLTNKKFINALTQILVLTLDRKSIDALGEANIQIYPSAEQGTLSNGEAYCVIMATAQPDFDITAELYLQNLKPTTESVALEITASQVLFSPTSKIDSNNVQDAIEDLSVIDTNLSNRIDNLDDNLSTKADLVNGKVPASQLPSYVDDTIEGYYNEGNFYLDVEHQSTITPETGKIYVDLSTNTSWRWSGSQYIRLDSGVVIGTVTGTAFDGGVGTSMVAEVNTLRSEFNGIVGGGITVGNAQTVNRISVVIENGVLKIGNIILPQNVELYKGTTAQTTINLSQEIAVGDKLEIEYISFSKKYTHRFVVNTMGEIICMPYTVITSFDSDYAVINKGYVAFTISANSLTFSSTNSGAETQIISTTADSQLTNYKATAGEYHTANSSNMYITRVLKIVD